MTNIINENTVVNATQNSTASISTSTDVTGVTKEQALNLIETLVTDKAYWEQNAFKTSNDLLYSLLQRCYGYYVTMCDDNADGQAARDALNEYIVKNKFEFKKSTHNITKIVKCVFGADRRRVSAYSIALRTAFTNKIKPFDVVQFIIDNGGVEEIRLAKSTTALSPAEKIERASASVSATVLFKFKSNDVSMSLDTSNIGKQIVLIATQGANGEVCINAVINNETAVKTALIACYGASKKSNTAAAKIEASKLPQQAAAEAVEAAVEKLAA
jgi:hypothetical protein